MPRCRKCNEWFFTQKEVDRHFKKEHYANTLLDDREEERHPIDENLLISAGIPYRGVQDYEEERVTGGGGEFGGGGASGDWDSDSDSDCCDSDCSSCEGDE